MVAPPFPLAAFERGALPDGDERVLQVRASFVMGMDVTGGDRAYAERPGEVAQPRVPAYVSSLVGSLELDEEALGPE